MAELANDPTTGGDTTTAGIRVFVYGTLKKDHPNHHLLEDSEFLGRCKIEDRKVRMVSLGGFPGVIGTQEKPTPVYGEVYRVTPGVLDSMDVLEGHPDFYRRVKIATPYKNAWVYLLSDRYGEYPAVDEGCWRPTDEEAEFWRTHDSSGGSDGQG